MITLEIKINGKTIGQRMAWQTDGPWPDGKHTYKIQSQRGDNTLVRHSREAGAVKLAELMLATMADDGTRNLVFASNGEPMAKIDVEANRLWTAGVEWKGKAGREKAIAELDRAKSK